MYFIWILNFYTDERPGKILSILSLKNDKPDYYANEYKT